MNPFILPAMGLIVSPKFLYKDGFGIKLHTMVDMSLNKETKVVFIIWEIIKLSVSDKFNWQVMTTRSIWELGLSKSGDPRFAKI